MSNVIPGSRISQLPRTTRPSLDHVFPASKDGETVGLLIQQVKDVLALRATDVGFRDTSVEEALAAVVDSPSQNYDQELASLGGRISTLEQRVPLAFIDLGTVAAGGSIAANFSQNSGFRAAPAGSATLAVSNLSPGQDGQVNVVYAAGTLSFSGVDWWDLGDGTVSVNFGATVIGSSALVAGAVYQFVFTRAEGVTCGRVGRVK